MKWGPFITVDLNSGVTLDFTTMPADKLTPQHYAFLVSEEQFDAAYAQIRPRGIKHRALRRLVFVSTYAEGRTPTRGAALGGYLRPM